jgi:hypothetical protein
MALTTPNLWKRTAIDRCGAEFHDAIVSTPKCAKAGFACQLRQSPSIPPSIYLHLRVHDVVYSVLTQNWNMQVGTLVMQVKWLYGSV